MKIKPGYTGDNYGKHENLPEKNCTQALYESNKYDNSYSYTLIVANEENDMFLFNKKIWAITPANNVILMSEQMVHEMDFDSYVFNELHRRNNMYGSKYKIPDNIYYFFNHNDLKDVPVGIDTGITEEHKEFFSIVYSLDMKRLSRMIKIDELKK
jgi:hypothetical protein